MSQNSKCIPGLSPPPAGTPIPGLSWRPAHRDLYASALLDSSVLSTLSDPITTPAQLDAAFSRFDAAVLDASAIAGMPAHIRRPSVHRNAPFYDAECVASKRLYRAALRRGAPPVELRGLERAYHNLVRGKRRLYQRQHLFDLLDCQRRDPRRFWKRLRRSGTALPLSLHDPHVWTPYLTSLCNTLPVHPPVFPAYAHPLRLLVDSAPLNVPLTEDEVLQGLKRLHNGRSSATSGMVGELYRYAQHTPSHDHPSPDHILLPYLHRLLNSFFHLGHIPACANVSTVTPIFKKGDPSDTSNYRPIAVSSPILRLYANVLNARLLDFTEERQLRSQTQAGFRPSLSTLHPVFVLQHLIDTTSRTQPLYCCFLDLKAAYDYVYRPFLWEALARLGIRGRILTALQSLYAQSHLAIKIGNYIGPELPSLTGVKQGCPLSPTLFGLFVDGLTRYIAHYCPGLGATLSDGSRLPALLYADDVALLATSPDDLQTLIDSSAAFCKAVGLRLSPAKTSVMSFPHVRPSYVWTCEGLEVQRVSTVTYLGMVLDSRWGVLSTCLSREQKMWAAWASLQRQYAGLDCGVALGLLSRLYTACVTPVASYGCEVWGLRDMPHRGGLGPARDQLELGHVNILRRILGLRKSTPRHIVLMEGISAPLKHSWILRTATFWNTLGGFHADSIFRRVALDSVLQALEGISNWASAFASSLASVAYPFALELGVLQPVDMQFLRHLLVQQLTVLTVPECTYPRTCPSEGVISCTYAQWFQRPLVRCPRSPMVHLTLPVKIHRQFMRFRSGCSDLPIDKGRCRRKHLKMSCPCSKTWPWFGRSLTEKPLAAVPTKLTCLRTPRKWSWGALH